MTGNIHQDELDAVAERYERRQHAGLASIYEPTEPVNVWANQQRERSLLAGLRLAGLTPLSEKRVVEVGCGSGDNLLQLIRLGAAPENMIANELLADRLDCARRRLPSAVTVIGGDASTLEIETGTIDIALQFTVFTSILDERVRSELASQMWRWIRPGGAIVWYDFSVNNPNNEDVRRVTRKEIRALFPHGECNLARVTLAPPIARRVARRKFAYDSLSMVRPLRTHVMGVIRKSPETDTVGVDQ
jgi:SAM-dependent methyltransferase